MKVYIRDSEPFMGHVPTFGNQSFKKNFTCQWYVHIGTLYVKYGLKIMGS